MADPDKITKSHGYTTPSGILITSPGTSVSELTVTKPLSVLSSTGHLYCAIYLICLRLISDWAIVITIDMKVMMITTTA